MQPKWIVSLDDGPQRVNHSAVVIRNEIFMFGGFCTGRPTMGQIDVHALNTAKLQWRKVDLHSMQETSDIPYMRYGHSSVALDEKAYLFGGRNDDMGSCNKLFYFDPAKLLWFKPDVTGCLPPARDGHGMCVARGNIYVFGGYVSHDNHGGFPEEMFMLDMETMSWTLLTTKGHHGLWRDFCSLSSFRGKIYLFGGKKDDAGVMINQLYDNDIKVIDLDTLEWCSVAKSDQALPPGRRSHTAFFHGTSLYIFGGFNSELDTHFNDLWKFDTETGYWTKIHTWGNRPRERRRHCCCYLNDRVYIFGGTSPPLPSSQTQDLLDQSDTHVLDLEPTLKSLSMDEVVKNWYRVDLSGLPTDLEKEILTLIRAGRRTDPRQETQG